MQRKNPSPYLSLTEDGEHISPSPAAVAWATRISQEDFFDVYKLAMKIDQVAHEARTNERRRIFAMSFTELMSEFWSGRKLRRG
jgi:hypothetical protein